MSRVRIGVSVPPQLPSAGIPAYARRAESAGFDELWLAEDCFFATVIGRRLGLPVEAVPPLSVDRRAAGQGATAITA